MNFGEALEMAREGRFIRRDFDHLGWRAGAVVGVSNPVGAMTQAFLFIVDSKGEVWPWTPNQGDLFADDWITRG